MGKGIAAAIMAFFPILSIVGIILGGINNGAVKKYLAAGGVHTGKVKAASITSKVGLIAGIIMTIIYIIYFSIVILGVIGIVASQTGSY